MHCALPGCWKHRSVACAWPANVCYGRDGLGWLDRCPVWSGPVQPMFDTALKISWLADSCSIWDTMQHHILAADSLAEKFNISLQQSKLLGLCVLQCILSRKSIASAVCKLLGEPGCLLSNSLQVGYHRCLRDLHQAGAAATVGAGSVGTSAVAVAAVTTSPLSSLCSFRAGAVAGRLGMVSADRLEPLPLFGEPVDRSHEGIGMMKALLIDAVADAG